MKKLVALSLLAVALVGFSIGCGGPTTAPAERTTTAEHNPESEHDAGSAAAEHAAK